MRFFVTGGSGVLGREALRVLRERGHETVALVRSDAAERAVAGERTTALRGDLFDPALLERGIAGCDAVLHLATSIPRRAIPRLRDFAENDRIREQGTALLAERALRAGAAAILFQSVAFIFDDHGGAVVDEATPPSGSPILRSALRGEAIVLSSPLRGVVVRGGQFLAAGSHHAVAMEALLRRRRLPLIGKGEAHVQPVHPRDVARAFVLAAEREDARGIFHVAAEPVPARELFGEWARRLGAPPPRRIPYWLARIVLGPLAPLAHADFRVSSEKARRQLGLELEFPTYREILDALSR